MKTHDENGLPRQYHKVCSPKEGVKFTTFWRFSIRPDLANNLTDSGTMADEIQRKFPAGVDKVLEMIGTVTLEDSLHGAKQGGIVFMTGIVGDQWSFERFAPRWMQSRLGVYLTCRLEGLQILCPRRSTNWHARLKQTHCTSGGQDLCSG